jgi:3-hydroxyacyl-CoA dehydrogenase/enoyl-CoA hydratase/3-hydroxybutyryl-CoA epimerase
VLGWLPAAQGGVLAQVERRGLAAFVADCDRLADRHGERFRPSPWLRGVASLRVTARHRRRNG